jgi:hypothetical protein
VKLIITAAAAIGLSGCITIPEEQREEMRYRETDRINRFMDYSDSCEHAGGLLIVQTTGRLRRNGAPRPSDRYECTRPVPGSGLG